MMKLKEFMEVRGFTIEDAGKFFGFPYSTIWYYIEGKREPKVSDALKIVERSGGAVQLSDLVIREKQDN